MFSEIGRDYVIRHKFAAFGLGEAFVYRSPLIIGQVVDAEVLDLDVDDSLHQFSLCFFRPVGDAIKDAFNDLIHNSKLS